MKLDAFATEAHYIEHLMPIWLELDRDHRGHFYMPDSLIDSCLERWGPPLALRDDRPVGASRPQGQRTMVAGFIDLQKVKQGRAVFLEHGVGQTYDACNSPAAGHAGYPGGIGRERVDLFICPNRDVARRNRATYPNAAAAVVGCPKLDPWIKYPTPKGNEVVAFGFHWRCGLVPEAGTAWDHYRSAVHAFAQHHGPHNVIGHAHPRLMAEARPLYERWGIPVATSFEHVLAVADLYVADNTSTLYEFAATGRPVLALNDPKWRRDCHHGLRFWDAIPGPQVDRPDDLTDAITAQLETPTLATDEVLDRAYTYRDGNSTARALNAITWWLDHIGGSTLDWWGSINRVNRGGQG